MDTGTDNLQTPSAETEESQGPSNPNMPLSPNATLPPPAPNPDPDPSPASSVDTAGSVELIPVPCKPRVISTEGKTPSTERFLGDSYERFWPVGNYATSNGSSAQGSGTENTLSPASNFTLKSISRSITHYLFVVLNKVRMWSLKEFITVPFAADAWARLIPQATKLISSIKSTVAATPPQFIKTVPMPPFPIRVFYGKPPPFSLEAQRRKMRWRCLWHWALAPELVQKPDTQRIQETVQQYVEFIAPETETISVELLAQGAFNQAYNIIAENKATGFCEEYVFRVALPIYPHYKLESDVATTEFVRHTTTVPVPIIYAFDSSPNNKLGFEWMLMEKVKGVSLDGTWDTMGYSTKQELARTVANWMDQLSRLEFDKIGSLYYRQRAGEMEFYLGPTLHSRLYEGDRLLYDIPRGPFESLRAFYDAVLESTERYVNDPRHRARHELEAAMHDIHSPMSDDESSEGSQHDDQKSEEEILAQADKKYLKWERWFGVTTEDLDWIPDELRIYRDLLPKLCPLPPGSEPMTTMLTHPDLSAQNIFVDESGALVALIDWERARIEPAALFNAMPRFLLDDFPSGPDCFYIRPGSKVSAGRKTNQLYLYDDETIAQIRGRNERSYKQVMESIQQTHLRALYREELQRLQSPICKAFEKDAESLEQQLISRVLRPENAEPDSATDWAVEHLGESILAELGGKHGNEDQEERAEGGATYEEDIIVETPTAKPVDT